MAIIDLEQLQQHAADFDYRLSLVPVLSLVMVKGILKSASRLDAPIVLQIEAGSSIEEILPSLEIMLKKADVAASIVGCRIQTKEQAVNAIRFGCNGLSLDQNLTLSKAGEIASLAESCGIPIIDQERLAERFIIMDSKLEESCLEALQKPASWQALNDQIEQVAALTVESHLNKTQAVNKGADALKVCNSCQPVEHLIIYNSNCNEKKTQAIAAKGREVLDKIPGVRQTWSGVSVNEDASYRWCWLIRFTNKRVIESYREHPDHVAYANNHFRPYAGDRISIDYELMESKAETV